MSKFTIKGRLSGLNEVIRVNRSNKYQGNKLKQENELLITVAIRQAKLTKVTNYPITMIITWYEPNLKRDADNVMSAVKFIMDSLVKERIIENDSLKYVSEYHHKVKLDRDNPRIEVEIKEA